MIFERELLPLSPLSVFATIVHAGLGAQYCPGLLISQQPPWWLVQELEHFSCFHRTSSAVVADKICGR